MNLIARPCKRCCFGGLYDDLGRFDPQLERNGWRPGLVLTAEAHVFVDLLVRDEPPGPRPSPYYEACPVCGGCGDLDRVEPAYGLAAGW